MRGVAPARRVFVTHMHGDHCFGLPGLLRGVSRRVLELGIAEPSMFWIYGPPGVPLIAH